MAITNDKEWLDKVYQAYLVWTDVEDATRKREAERFVNFLYRTYGIVQPNQRYKSSVLSN
jgi:hypothetical protein